jgi:hypothetical protein
VVVLFRGVAGNFEVEATGGGFGVVGGPCQLQPQSSDQIQQLCAFRTKDELTEELSIAFAKGTEELRKEGRIDLDEQPE